jgi:hypothetical protein
MATKPQVPKVVLFVCESCQGHYSADYVREHEGICAHCQGESWTLEVSFIEQKLNYSFSLLWLVAAVLAGFGWHPFLKTERLDMTFPKVSGPDAFTICQVPFREQYRVLEYIKYRQQLDADEQRQKMIDRGGQTCSHCGTLFVPREDKPWSQAGFCSKLCHSQAAPKFTELRGDGGEE